MRADLIITWPTGCDFPVWRSFLRLNRDRFNKVIIVMSNTDAPHDYTSFLKDSMKEDKVEFIDAGSYIVLDDWRSSAVNAALARSEAGWVWFTEQDFFISDPNTFFRNIEEKAKDNDFMHIMEGDRLHPACMFVRREFIDKTRLDFGIIPNKADHFGKFVDDLKKEKARTYEIKKAGDDFYHMNGLTHNYSLIERGEIENIYQPGLFQLYNSYARMQGVQHDPYFLDLSFKVDVYLSPISRFFMAK